MKATRINIPLKTFTPIKVEFTIDTQEEYDALLLAEQSLCRGDIFDEYDWTDRGVWVNTLDAIARASRSDGDDK
jgi:hypothetical protein